jgi:cytochrome c biogenesis protein CcmG, thiol:disulfide interchange protein DsbE
MPCMRVTIKSRHSKSRKLCTTLQALILLATTTLLAAPPRSLLHKQAPTFVREDLNHQRIDLAAYRGRVVLLTFWATWCAPCQIEMPHFIEWQNRYGPDGLQIIGISMDDDAGPVLTLTRKRKVNYPIVMGDQKLGTLYGGILGLPVTYLIDRNGMVSAKFKGESSLVNMESKIEILLNQKPSKALAR